VSKRANVGSTPPEEGIIIQTSICDPYRKEDCYVDGAQANDGKTNSATREKTSMPENIGRASVVPKQKTRQRKRRYQRRSHQRKNYRKHRQAWLRARFCQSEADGRDNVADGGASGESCKHFHVNVSVAENGNIAGVAGTLNGSAHTADGFEYATNDDEANCWDSDKSDCGDSDVSRFINTPCWKVNNTGHNWPPRSFSFPSVPVRSRS